MKHFLLALFLFPVCLVAQNLVPNYSFEQYDTCPNYFSQIYRAIGWNGFSADYFNACDKGDFGVPENFAGYQYASTGNAYSGIITYLSGSNYSEFIQTTLDSSLRIGQKYYLSMKVSLSRINSIQCASNNIGILFTNSLFADTGPPPIYNFAQVYSHSIISDTMNWTIISGSFIADSAYSYISIGNFFDTSYTKHIGTVGSAYYYVDDVCVSSDSLGCELSNGINSYILNKKVNVYPVPANDLLNVTLPSAPNTLIIYSILGQEVYSSIEQENKASINVSHFPNGIYFLQIKTGNNILYKQFIIQK